MLDAIEKRDDLDRMGGTDGGGDLRDRERLGCHDDARPRGDVALRVNVRDAVTEELAVDGQPLRVDRTSRRGAGDSDDLRTGPIKQRCNECPYSARTHNRYDIFRHVSPWTSPPSSERLPPQ